MNGTKKLLLTLLAMSLVLLVYSVFGFGTITAAEPGTGIRKEVAVETKTGKQTAKIPDNSDKVLSAVTTRNWGLISVNADKVWDLTRGQNIIVAVLDTGIDKEHEDLKGKVISEVNFSDSKNVEDVYGHGTHIAGIIAGSSSEGGVTGVAPEARLLNVKVANDKGRSNANWVAQGIVWAVDNGANVINLSIELLKTSPELPPAVAYAENRGVLIVAASGNHGIGVPIYPAYYDDTIAVAAIRAEDTPAPLTNRGDWIDVAAPGFNIYSALPGGSYGYKSGTSVAAAYVSGLASLLFTIVSDENGNGKISDEVRTAIEQGCRTIDLDGIGNGKINALASVLGD